MKSSTAICAALGGLLAVSSAFATGTTTPPAPSPAPTSSSSTSGSSSNSGSSSDSSAVSGPSTSSATGGNAAGGSATGGSVGNLSASGVGQGGSASGGQSFSDTGDLTNVSKTSSTWVNFPQPVWTTVPQAFGCLVSEADAVAVGWSFFSKSGARQFSDAVCTTIRMSEAAVLHCQYETAALLNKTAFEMMYPGKNGDFFVKGSPKDMDPVACDALRRPNLRMAPMIQAAPVALPQPHDVNVNVSCLAPSGTKLNRQGVKPRTPKAPAICK